MHNKFLSQCGVSMICLVAVLGTGAYAKTTVTPLFEFSVGSTAGADGCTPAVSEDVNGCTVITPKTRVSGVCQSDTSNARTICPGHQGVAGTPACAPHVTTEPGSGTNAGCTRMVITPQIKDSNGCIDDPAGTTTHGEWVCNGCTPTYTKTYINQVGNNEPTYNNASRTESTVGERTTIEGCGTPIHMDVYDGPAGQDSVCTFSSSRNATSGVTTFKYTCNGNTEQTMGTIDENNIATYAIGKITAAGTFATPQDVADATNKTTLVDKLTGEFATAGQLGSTNSAVSALQSGKVNNTDFETYQTTVANALNGKADADSVYNKTEVDNTVANLEQEIIAASSGLTPEQVEGMINTAISGKYYTKTEANQQFATASALSSLGAEVDDKLDTADFGDKLKSAGVKDDLTSAINGTGVLSNYATTSQLNNKLTITDLPTELGKTNNINAVNSIIGNNSIVNGKLDASDFGSTLTSSAQSSNLATALGATAPTATINGIVDTNLTVGSKASQSDLNTLAGRVTANETAIASKANLSDVYTKGEIDSQLSVLATKEELAAASVCSGTIRTESSGGKITVYCDEE